MAHTYRNSLVYFLASQLFRTNNFGIRDSAKETIEELCREFMPSGSGFDCGTKFDFDASKENRLVFETAFHHMDENGFYDGWTEHKVIVTPDFTSGMRIRVTGRNRRDIKEYITSVFDNHLEQTIESSFNQEERTFSYKLIPWTPSPQAENAG